MTFDSKRNFGGRSSVKGGVKFTLDDIYPVGHEGKKDSCRNFMSGADGTRTRDLLRDRQAF
jgi:hypothetical protein